MGEWEITLGIEMAPNADPDCQGLANQWPDTNGGRVTLRADLEDNEEWETVLVHELLHIKHGRIDQAVMHVLEPHIGDVPTELTEALYRAQVEPFIHSLARSLVKLRYSIDTLPALKEPPA